MRIAHARKENMKQIDNVHGGAGLLHDTAYGLATGTDDDADLFRLDLQAHDAGSILAQLRARSRQCFQHFPEEVRPATCITRHADEVSAFLEEHDGKGVLKPLQGSGGQGVFIVDKKNRQNLNQIIESITRDGYAIVQEYLPAAAEGDLRVITLNGRPLQVDGTFASLRRSSTTEDHRSNLSAGGKADLEQPDEAAMRAAEMCAPKLIDDGMYLAGLDIVGDRMIEVNVDSPGALSYMEDLSGVDFSGAIIDDLERKVRLKKNYSGTLSNRHLAVV